MSKRSLLLLGTLISACLENPNAELDPASSDAAVDDATAEVASKAEALYRNTSELWPSANIPVCWEKTAISASTADQRYMVQAAVAETWSKYSPVRFTGWGTCEVSAYPSAPSNTPTPPPAENTPGIHIAVVDMRAGVTDFGKFLDRRAGGMTLNFTFNDWKGCDAGGVAGPRRDFCIKAIAVHEFGHALGFHHEQNRPDNHGRCSNEAVPESGPDFVTLGDYDPSSIMNYCAFERNYGQLSAGDISGLRRTYGVGYASAGELRKNCENTADGSNLGSYKTCLADYSLPYVKDDAVWVAKAKQHCFDSQAGRNKGAESYNGYKTCLAEREVTFVPDQDWCNKVAAHCGNNAQCTLERSCPSATFYQHGGYGGYGVSLVQGSYTMGDLSAKGIINDDISSIRVPAGVKVTIYQHDGYQGWSANYTSDVDWLAQYNDQISSVLISTDTPGFLDANGYTCSGWVSYDCTQSGWYYRYTQAQLHSVATNCRASCRQMSGTCTDTAGFVDARNFRCADWVGYDCGTAAHWGYTEAETFSLLANCRASCGRCSTQ